MRQSITVPFTIKIRGGWDDEHLNAVEVARMAESEGVGRHHCPPALALQPLHGQGRRGRSSPRSSRPCVSPSPATATWIRDTARRMSTRRVPIGDGGPGRARRPWIFDAGFDALPAAAQREYKDRIIAATWS